MEISNVPPNLSEKAIFLSGEPSWTTYDSLQVIDWLASVGIAVVGVELWKNINGAPQWIATSDYSPAVPIRKSDLDICTQEAKKFVHRFDDQTALFNLTWQAIDNS